MELQPRDLAILETTGDLGTADTQIIHALHFPADTTGRACQQRLRKITEAGLLKRVWLIAADGVLQSGSRPALFFLTPEGAQLVADETGLHPRRVTRSDPKPYTLRHRLETVRARLAIDEAAEIAELPPPEWIMEQDTRPDLKRTRSRSPSDYFILKHHYDRGGRRVTFFPDAACHLQVPFRGTRHHLIAYLEVDRSTEGHRQWERKLWGIEAFLADQKGPAGHWPQVYDEATEEFKKRPPLVLVFCKSQARQDNLIETTQSSPAAKLIRFTTYPLDPERVLTGEVWQTCDGELKAIIGRL